MKRKAQGWSIMLWIMLPCRLPKECRRGRLDREKRKDIPARTIQLQLASDQAAASPTWLAQTRAASRSWFTAAASAPQAIARSASSSWLPDSQAMANLR